MESKLLEEKEGDKGLGEGGGINGLDVAMETKDKGCGDLNKWAEDCRLS